MKLKPGSGAQGGGTNANSMQARLDGGSAGRRLRSAVRPEHFGLHAGAAPVRERPKRSYFTSWCGDFASNKALGPAPHESLLERDCQTLLCVDARIKCYAVQPHELHYWAPGGGGEMMKHRYTPDIAAVDAGGRVIVIEVKAKRLRRRSKWALLEPYIRKAYEQDHGVRFLVFTEDQIRAQPRLSNCQIILRHRGPPDDLAAELAMREIIGDGTGEAVLAQLTRVAADRGLDARRSFSALMRLAMAGVIGLDLSEPLSPSTRIFLGGWR